MALYVGLLAAGFFIRWKRGRWKRRDLLANLADPPAASAATGPLP